MFEAPDGRCCNGLVSVNGRARAALDRTERRPASAQKGDGMPQLHRITRIISTVCRAALGAGVVALVLTAGTASAQNIGQTTGQIEGVVVDATGAVLPGVTLTFSSPALAGTKVVVTDGNGAFVVPGLPAGLYRVEAVLHGFTTAVVESVDLRPGQVIRPAIKMSPGLTEQVTVIASPVLDVMSSAASNNLSAEIIDELPKGRSWDTVVQLAPAVNPESTQGEKGISFRGASIAENSYIVDGVDTTSVVVGTAGQDVVIDFVDEVQVKSGFVGADYGGALGGIVNVVTKSGSNDFRGLLSLQYSGSSLTSDPRQRLRVVPTNSRLAEYVQDREDPQRQFDLGGTLGGRVVKDRVWFFVGYMPQVIDTDRDVTFTSGASGSFSNAVRRNFFTSKLTARLANTLTMNASVSISPDNWLGQLPAQDGTSPANVPYAERGRDSTKTAYGLSLDWIPSAKFFLNAFAGYHEKKTSDVGVPQLDRYRYVNSNIGLAGVPDNFQHPTNWETSPETTNVYNNDDDRFSFGATASTTFDLGGRHLLKVGFQYSAPHTYLNYRPTKERVDLHWNLSFAGQRGTYGYWRAFDINTDGNVNSDNQAVYIQDMWTAGRFTINAGLRTEREKLTPFTSTNNPTKEILFGFADKLAPRLGIAWDVRGDSSWKVYANGGLFYDMMKHSAPRDGFGGGVFKIDYYALDTFDYTQLNKASPAGRKLFTLDLRGTGALLDPGIKPARTNVYDVGTEIQMGKTMSLGVGYVHRSVSNANEDAQVLQPNGTSFQKILGNPGKGRLEAPYANYGAAYPKAPLFERNYDGVDIILKKRFANNWAGSVSYTISRLEGNFDGLADPDQQIYADVNPNVGIYCDYLEGCYTSTGALDYGRLSADRPHQFKVSGSYAFPWGLTAGVFFQAVSGTPITANVGVNSATVTHPTGRGGDGRNPMMNQTDLSLQYGFKLGGRARLSAVLNVINVFDQTEATRTFQNMLMGGSTSVRVPIAQYFQGYDYRAVVAASGAADPRFLMRDRFQAPRTMRIGVKLQF